MFDSFHKKFLIALVVLFSFHTTNSFLDADEYPCCSECNNRLYIGAFGGQLYSNATKFVQTGTVFFSEATGGPLAIDARGHSRKNTLGFGGVQIGYEWRRPQCATWSLNPAAELEAFFFRRTHKAHLLNPSDRLPEHDFLNTFPTDVGVYLVNGVFAVNNCCWRGFSPYVGVGVGAANICIRKAKSFQVSPPEVGLNHFSDRTDTAWAFAAQIKAGLRYNICARFHIFAEYRFLYVDSSRYLFGSTVVPGHAPTSPWNVDMKSMYYNAYTVGIQLDL